MRGIALAMGLVVLLYAKPPTPTQIQARQNHINGYATECMMDSFFMYGQNWKKIEGESGIHGIDGLYIKYQGGHISDILVAESKYNHSRLGWTKKHTIRQMSKAWIVQKLKEAKPHNPKIKNFDKIIKLAKNGIYRARLFKLKPLSKSKFKIILYRIKSKSSHVQKKKITTKVIDILQPKNSFEKAMAKSFFRCKKEASGKN